MSRIKKSVNLKALCKTLSDRLLALRNLFQVSNPIRLSVSVTNIVIAVENNQNDSSGDEDSDSEEE